MFKLVPYKSSTVGASYLTGMHFCRPQMKFAKIMFLHVSVILSTGGGMHGGGVHGGGMCAWQGACMAGGMHVWQGCAWRGNVHGRGHAWRGGCVAGGCVPWQILWDTVNERAVRILLECILVVACQNTTFYETVVTHFEVFCHSLQVMNQIIGNFLS